MISDINLLSEKMLSQFKHLKNDTGILDVIEEFEDHFETNQALKELYPDAVFTFDDIVADNAKDPASELGKYIANRSQSPARFIPEIMTNKSFNKQELQNKRVYKTNEANVNINMMRNNSSQSVVKGRNAPIRTSLRIGNSPYRVINKLSISNFLI